MEGKKEKLTPTLKTTLSFTKIFSNSINQTQEVEWFLYNPKKTRYGNIICSVKNKMALEELYIVMAKLRRWFSMPFFYT